MVKQNPPRAGINHLSKRQRRAVLAAADSHVAVFAGAGTGKTATLTATIRWLLSHTAMPCSILAVTFGRRATAEIQERVGSVAEGALSISTIHALGANIVQEYAAVLGFKRNIVLMLKADEIQCLKQIMKAHGLSARRKKPVQQMHAKITDLKHRGILPAAAARGTARKRKLATIYAAFQTLLKKINAFTYDDQILHALAILQGSAEARASYAGSYSHILIDEFQDLNPTQYQLLKLIAGSRSHFWVVGDDDQSIMTWRGADGTIMQQFTHDFPNVKIIMLERNRRSTGNIVACSGIIERNKLRRAKRLFTKKPPGAKVKIHRLADHRAEAEYIVRQIRRKLKSSSKTPVTIAVLARFKQVLKPIAKMLTAEGISCHIVGEAPPSARRTVHTAVAYLQAFLNPNNELALEAIINTPKRGIGPKTVADIKAHAAMQKATFWTALQQFASTGKMAKCTDFVDQFIKWRRKSPMPDARQTALRLLKKSGYLRSLLPEDKTLVEEFLAKAPECSNMSELVNVLATDIAEARAMPNAAVTLMTIHAAKSGEFTHIFSPGWEEGVFPDYRAVNSKNPAKMEEERRLAYVAITRACKSLCITHIVKRRPTHAHAVDEVRPSRFLAELPPDAIKRTISKHANGLVRSGNKGKGFSKKINIGDIVSHNGDFGYGKVKQISGTMLTVDFNEIGLREVRVKKVSKV